MWACVILFGVAGLASVRAATNSLAACSADSVDFSCHELKPPASSGGGGGWLSQKKSIALMTFLSRLYCPFTLFFMQLVSFHGTAVEECDKQFLD